MIARRSRKQRAEMLERLRSIVAILRVLPASRRAAAQEELIRTARALVEAANARVTFRN